MVSGVVIQGGKHRDRNVFMKRFKVGHSVDGKDWTFIKEDNTTRPKVGLIKLHNFKQGSGTYDTSQINTHLTIFAVKGHLFPLLDKASRQLRHINL